MSLEKMKAKILIAEELQDQSREVWAFRVRHFVSLSLEDRLKLKEASRTLNARADEVLEDALEEGTEDAEELIDKLAFQTTTLRAHASSLNKIGEVLSTAAKIAKVAAGVVSGGITNALSLLG
jgi:DNA-directed RNA polymerase subunit L